MSDLTPEMAPQGTAEVEPETATPEKAQPGATNAPASWGLLAWIQSILLIFVVALFIITFIAQAFVIPSGSMETTLLVGDYVFVDKTHFNEQKSFTLLPSRPICRGDIIVFHYPEDPKEHFVKRVVALPGDRLRLHNKRLYINGTEQIEPYARFTVFNEDHFRDDFPGGDRYGEELSRRWQKTIDSHVVRGELVVPPGAYFAMGDNRDDSLDSRFWGFVPETSIIGRPLVIYWSMRMQPLDDEDAQPDAPPVQHRPLHSLAALWSVLHSAVAGIHAERIFHVIH